MSPIKIGEGVGGAGGASETGAAALTANADKLELGRLLGLSEAELQRAGPLVREAVLAAAAHLAQSTAHSGRPPGGGGGQGPLT